MSEATSHPDVKPRRWIWVAIVGMLLVAALGIFATRWIGGGPNVTGTWKGVDTHGHEHYFQFSNDGSCRWWDRDRRPDGSFDEGEHRRGSYNAIDNERIAIMSGGSQTSKMRVYADQQARPMGTLTLVSPDELKQDNTGDFPRHRLTYHRESAK